MRPLLFLLAELLIGTAGGAVAAPITPLSCPETEAQLLDVQVGDVSRGTHFVSFAGERIWVEPQILQPGEETYIESTQTCAGTPLALLRSEVSWRTDFSTQQLLLTPNLTLLSPISQTLPPRKTLPASQDWVFRADYALSLSGQVGTAQALQNEALILQAQAARGPLELNAHVNQLFSAGNAVVLQGGLDLTYTTPTAKFAAVYNRPSSLTGRLFTGAQFNWQHDAAAVQPLSVALPLPATIRVLEQGLERASFQAPAGIFHLTGVVGDQPLTLIITDATGTRQVEIPAQPSAASLSPGAARLRTEGGWSIQQPYGAALFEVGLAPKLSATLAARQLADQTRLQAGLTLKSGRQEVQAGYEYTHTPTGNLPALRLRASTGGQVWNLGLETWIPFDASSMPWYDVSASVGNARTSVVAQARFSASQPPLWRLDTQFRPSDLTSLNLFVQEQNTLWRAGVSWQFVLGAARGSVSADSAGPLIQGEVALNDHLQVLARTGRGASEFGVQYQDAVDLRASVQTNGLWSAQVAGHLLTVAGKAEWNTQTQGGLVRVLTGVPHLRLTLNGGQEVVTDALGIALLSGTTTLSPNTLRVNVNALPDNVIARQALATFRTTEAPLTDFDWQGNFQRSEWVQFFWAEGEAAGSADLHFPDVVLSLDTEGYLLLDGRNIHDAELRSQDGSRRCHVKMDERNRARCVQG